CRPDFAVALYPGQLWTENNLELNPSIRVTRQTPATFLLQAENDPNRSRTELASLLGRAETSWRSGGNASVRGRWSCIWAAAYGVSDYGMAQAGREVAANDWDYSEIGTAPKKNGAAASIAPGENSPLRSEPLFCIYGTVRKAKIITIPTAARHNRANN